MWFVATWLYASDAPPLSRRSESSLSKMFSGVGAVLVGLPTTNKLCGARFIRYSSSSTCAHWGSFCKTIHPTSVSSSVKSGRLLDPGGNFFSIFCFSSFRLVQQMPFLKPGSDLTNFRAWPRYKRFGLYITGPFVWHCIPQSDTKAYHSWGFAHAHFLLDLVKDMHWLIFAEIDFGLLLCEVFWKIVSVDLL